MGHYLHTSAVSTASAGRELVPAWFCNTGALTCLEEAFQSLSMEYVSKQVRNEA